MGDFSRDEMVEHLRGNVCQVTFVKKNGDVRLMNCTLVKQAIPESKRPIGESTIKENLEIIKVFDVDKGEWRSFRTDSVKDFSVSGVNAGLKAVV